MYNQYIYEKKINEEKLKQIENEKQKHFQKIYLKKRDKLSRQYNQKIHSFMLKLVSEMEPTKNGYFDRHNIKEIRSDKRINSSHKKKRYIKERIYSYNPKNTIKKKEIKITSLSNMKNNDNTLTNNELPKMKFRKKNDFERIKENLLKRDGIEFDEKLLKKLSDKHKKYISKQTYSFLKTNENNNMSEPNNKIYQINKGQNIILEQKDNNLKTEKWNDNQKYAIFKNKILNSKLIIDITNNEKYQNRTFYQALMQSLLFNNNSNNTTKNKFTKIKPVLSPCYRVNKISNKRTAKDKEEKIYANSINFYQEHLKQFDKLFQKQKELNKNYSLSEESSDMSINDNGQKEIIKKIITLHYPLLREKNIDKKDELKNNLEYLKKLCIEKKKIVYRKEEKEKEDNNNEIINYIIERKNNKSNKNKKYAY